MEALALRSPVESVPAAEPLSDVARAAAGDVRAFEQLYRAHLPRVNSLVRRMTAGRDADELTQDVFVRVWQKLGTFRGDSSFATWLHRLAVNVVIERFRDSQALIEHGEHVAALMEPIIATASVSGELLGELSPELRAKMTGDVPQLFRLYR